MANSDIEKKELRVPLNEEQNEMFETIKDYIGINSKTEATRHIIKLIFNEKTESKKLATKILALPADQVFQSITDIILGLLKMKFGAVLTSDDKKINNVQELIEKILARFEDEKAILSLGGN